MSRPQDIEHNTLEAATARRMMTAQRAPAIDSCRHCHEPPGDPAECVAILTGGFVHGRCWSEYATRTFWKAAAAARRSLGLAEF